MFRIKKHHVKKTSIQLAKYGLVGVGNTAVTGFVFVVLNSVFNVNFYVSNVVGFVAGVINSFIWNKKWVFKGASDHVKREILLFLIGFAICYLIQMGVLWILMNYTNLQYIQIPGYEKFQLGDTLITGIGMVFYTLLNYIYNRFVTFKVEN
ncbi:MAG: GtrA family protein [Muribaculaceae bacterium]|nr:GtrA family protein [Muribaculaceae bacterium]